MVNERAIIQPAVASPNELHVPSSYREPVIYLFSKQTRNQLNALTSRYLESFGRP